MLRSPPQGVRAWADWLPCGYDRGMNEPIVVSVLGVRVEIDGAGVGVDARERIFRAWRDAMLPVGSPAETKVVARADVEPGQMLACLSASVMEAALARRSSDLWLLDAAGIADAQGHVLVFVDLCDGFGAHALRRLAELNGHTYLGGGMVGIDPEGQVVAYCEPTVPSRVGTQGLRLVRVVILSGSMRESAPAFVEHLRDEEQLKVLGSRSKRLEELRNGLHVVQALLKATGGAVEVTCRDFGDLALVAKRLLAGDSPARSDLIRSPTSYRSCGTRSGGTLLPGVCRGCSGLWCRCAGGPTHAQRGSW